MHLNSSNRKNKKRGTALLTSFGILTLLSVASVSYVNSATQTIQLSVRQQEEVQETHLCEAGVQSVLHAIWRPFKVSQAFFDMDDSLTGASSGSPKQVTAGSVTEVGKYSAGVIKYTVVNNYKRTVLIRAVGWDDKNNNGSLDAGEPSKIIEVNCDFELARSQVFDYTYFVNNYGWMEGFGPNDLVINGDVRSNGNFDFLSGSPTVNGSVFASFNEKLPDRGQGLINTPPQKWSDSTYASQISSTTPFASRWRDAYDSAKHGTYGSTAFEKWRDLVFASKATMQGTEPFGAMLGDSTGLRWWERPTSSAATTGLIDTSATQEVVMPDLGNMGTPADAASPTGSRIAKTKYYRDQKATYTDGTANPNYVGAAGTDSELNADGTPNVNYSGAYVDVWNSSTNSYQRVSSNGVLDGSAILIGSDTNPIRIHGPVAVTQDVVIKGTLKGQGTLYAGRNVHIVGSIKYKTPPNFRGSDPDAVEAAVEKADMLGLAARQSVIMGNPNSFSSYTLYYMTPPFTKTRLDEWGNTIPAYNALEVDSSGRYRYKSVISDSTMNSIAEGVNQIDAILYTNYLGGGNIGTSGGGVAFNGSIISKDESMIVYSLPMRMNYDTRIRERAISKQPLIDIDLPRSPTLLRSSWQDRGFTYGGS